MKNIIILDEECCCECGCYLGLLRSTLCWECEQDIRFQEEQEFEESWFWWEEGDELPYMEISPLALPRNEKPKRKEQEP